MEQQKLVVNLVRDTGVVKHGASGFLYGLGNDGLPGLNMLAPINPGVVAQKPPGGLQHPNGDCFDVAATFEKSGGKQIQIYMQDIYSKWPYETQDIEDYLCKIEKIIKSVLANPRRKLFAYVPFNEPDWIWYDIGERQGEFFKDWHRVYQKIRSLDPDGRIVGPNNAKYHDSFFEDFMGFCIAHDCLPDVISWHELNPDFFTEWYQHFNHYRQLEKDLDLSSRPVCINEYANWRDLSVPGRLVQWIVGLENCKVDGCLAYWHAAGNLDDLVTRNNEATGAWWLFKWYGELSGNTVEVVPNEAEVATISEGLQGLATLDMEKKQLRILFGGSSGKCDVILKGLESVAYFGGKVHIKTWSIAWSGYEGPSAGPVVEMESDYPALGGEVVVTVEDMEAASAYFMIVSGSTDTADNAEYPEQKDWKASYEAEAAEITDCKVITGGTLSNPNQNYHSNAQRVGAIEQDTSLVKFKVDVPYSGIYTLDIFYCNGHWSMAQQLLSVDNENYQVLEYHPNLAWGFIDKKTISLELASGEHIITFAKYDPSFGRANFSVDLDRIDLIYAHSTTSTQRYESEYAVISGKARIATEIAGYSGSGYAVFEGSGDSGLCFVTSQANHGFYRIKLRYVINSAPAVPATPIILMNVNNKSVELPCFGCSNQKEWGNLDCKVFLPAGINQISFGGHDNSAHAVIGIDYIEILAENGPLEIYEAQAPQNTLGGTVKVFDDIYASGGKYAGDIGNRPDNYLQFNKIQVAITGVYQMVIYYANAEKVGAHQYNVNIVDRYADIRVNKGDAKRVYFRNTFGWNSYRSIVIDLELQAGDNTIRFFNNDAAAPHIDRIVISPFKV